MFYENFNFIKSLNSFSVDLPIGSGAKASFYINFDKNTFKNGTNYIIAPYAKGSQSDDITPMRTPCGSEDWYFAQTEKDTVTLTLLGQPEPIKLSSGNYKAFACNREGKDTKWQMSIWKDDSEDNKYWLSDIDPEVSLRGYTYEKGWNKVYGILNNTGTRLTIPGNQTVGENIILRSMSSNDDITFIVSSDGNSLTATAAWGCICNGEEISSYTNTELLYGMLEPEPDVIDNPIIIWNEEAMTATITTSTEGASIYYTLDGKEPNSESTLYSQPISIDHNCVISAIVEKNGNLSDIKKLTINTFIVDKPVMEQKEGLIYINCGTSDAAIYYTLDGSDPTKNSTLYTSPFQLRQTATVKAIATKIDFIDSNIAEMTFLGPDPMPLVVENNVAGELNERIDLNSKFTIESLTVTGNLNGSDIKYIREMLANGNLSTLILTNANIVSGGDHYYEGYFSNYDTEDNVVGTSMFEYAKHLVTLKLPNSVKKIEMYAVCNNDNLLELALPASCEELEDYSLSFNKRLPSITMPRNLLSFSAKTFTFCDRLSAINFDPNNNNFTSKDGVVFTKDMESLIWYSPCKDDESYTIPSGVKTLGEGCFANARFRSVEIPEGVNTIESTAFEGCDLLTSINLPSSVYEIGMFAFSECGLFNIELFNVENVKTYAFYNNKNLTRVNIGSKLKKLSDTAFNGCHQLKEFNVDEDNQHFSAIDGVLYDKEQLKLYKFPTAKITSIFVVPLTVKEISNYAFYYCAYIKEVICGNSVEKVGSNAFCGSKCKSIKMDSNSLISEIGMYAFEHCEDLQSLIIPDRVEVLSMSCAANCKSLEWFKLPSSLTKIDLSALSNCPNLATIESKIIDMTQIEVVKDYYGLYNSFDGLKEDCLWVIPEGSASSYKSCPWWQNTWRLSEESNGIIETDYNTECMIDIIDGGITITSPIDKTIFVYTINGTLVSIMKVKSQIPQHIHLSAGIYLVEGHKIALMK